MSLLTIENLRKSFGSVTVLRKIGFSLERGEILGLVGENGAGKSTLVRCICGFLKPDAGRIDLSGKPYLVPQELTFVPSMTIAENLFLGREPTHWGLVDRAALRTRARVALARVGAEELSPDALIETLGVAAQQKVAIAKALIEKADLLVLDEPTAVLSREESELLFSVLRALCKEGVGVIYISHKLDEVLALCSQVAVLRDGEFVEGGPSARYTPRRLAELMVGRPLTEMYPPKEPAPDPTAIPALEVRGLSDGAAVKEATFALRPGEILGLAGLAGAGRTELAELVCGMRRPCAGAVSVGGREVRIASMADALQVGIAYLSEDRQGTALLVSSALRDNAALSSLQKYLQGPFLSTSRLSRAAQSRIHELHIKCEGPAQPVRALSGGNQQKVAIAKGLDTDPKVFIFDEPTRGVDVGARAEIYAIMHKLAASGVGVLMISSDLTEILGNCRRSLVMREGRIVGELEGEALTEKNVMLLAMGITR